MKSIQEPGSSFKKNEVESIYKKTNAFYQKKLKELSNQTARAKNCEPPVSQTLRSDETFVIQFQNDSKSQEYIVIDSLEKEEETSQQVERLKNEENLSKMKINAILN